MERENVSKMKKILRPAAAIGLSATIVFGYSGRNSESTPIIPVAEAAYSAPITPATSPDNTVFVESLLDMSVEFELLNPPIQEPQQTVEEKPITSPMTIELSHLPEPEMPALENIEGFDPNLRLPDRGYNEYWARYVYNGFAKAGRKSEAMEAVLVAQCESGLNPKVKHYNDNGTVDVGLMQINSSNMPVAQALDPKQNIDKGIELSQKNNGLRIDWVACYVKVRNFLAGR